MIAKTQCAYLRSSPTVGCKLENDDEECTLRSGFPQCAQMNRLFKWQIMVNAAFASGSLTAALFNLGVLISVTVAKALASQIPVCGELVDRHA